MKRISFLFVGKPKDKSYQSLEEHYLKRIQNFASVNIKYVKDSKEKDLSIRKKKEAQNLLKEISEKTFLIACDENGKSFTSKKFSQKLSQLDNLYGDVSFVIGGAFGFDEEILQRANFKLRLSDMTFPHELARVVLLEQVYRGISILKGSQYHH